MGLQPTAAESPFTPRVLLTGALLCLVISVGAPYSNVYLKGSMMALDFATAAAVFLLFLLVICNICLHLLHPSLAFGRNELAVIYTMMVVACAIPTMGLMEYLLPGLTALTYYSAHENDWQTVIPALRERVDGGPGSSGQQVLLRGAAPGHGHSLGGLGQTAPRLEPLHPGAVPGHDLCRWH